jgi:hypothetical protein
MNNTISFLFSQSILLPLIIGLIRIRKIQTSYYPFVALIILGTLTELLSYAAARLFGNNAVVSNIFSLFECLLILYQFYRWRFYTTPRMWYWAIPALCVLIWIAENLVFMYITEFRPVFRISYAFVIVMLSINEINYLITHENRQLFKNARFLICIGFIIFFLYQILLEGAYYISKTGSTPVISNKIFALQVYINAFVNVIYGAAMLLIPEKMFDFERTIEKLKKQYH